MCDHDAPQAFTRHFNAAGGDTASTGSRRHRLWELPRNCYCPVIGVCLPLDALRKLVNKGVRGQVVADDYEVHVGAVSECGSRNRVSEILQNALERRYAKVIKRFKTAKNRDAVTSLWQEAVRHGDVAGAFWAALTHPRSDGLLQETLCRDMHMIQHQAGASTRVDLNSFNALADENAVLARELANVQARCTQLISDQAREIDRLGAQIMQARADLIGRDSVISFLRADMAGLAATVPDLEPRARLKEKVAELIARQRAQDMQASELRHKLALAMQQVRALSTLQSAAARSDASGQDADAPSLPTAAQLADKTVLCVGGRPGSLSTYRGIIEQIGGRFAHHDGGLEDSSTLLDASLAAADLVICQTGCISHNAYWRVKDYCKRTGKRCVFVDNPSGSSFSRSLKQISIRDVTALVTKTET